MRDFKGMKRQRGRNRGGGSGNSGGKPQAQNANRAFDSNGPEGLKVRGNAQHVFEKYQQLARDASTAGDRVLAENYLQHAEHYFRLLRAMQPQRSAAEILGRDQFTSGFDIDFEDEAAQAQSEAADDAAAAAAEKGESPETAPADGEPRGERVWQDRPPRENRDNNQNRDRYESREGGRRDRWRDRDDRPRDDRPRDERPRDERPREDRPRDEQPREERPGRQDRVREDRPRAERSERSREDRPAREPVGEPAPVEDVRPGAMLRDAEGGESHAPAFLQAAPRTEGGDEAVRKPRRRRAPRTFEAGDAPAGGEPEDA